MCVLERGVCIRERYVFQREVCVLERGVCIREVSVLERGVHLTFNTCDMSKIQIALPSFSDG